MHDAVEEPLIFCCSLNAFLGSRRVRGQQVRDARARCIRESSQQVQVTLLDQEPVFGRHYGLRVEVD